MKIHVSGYDSNQKNYLKKIVEKFKLEFAEDFTVNTQILLCDSVFNQKYVVAKNKNIKIVKQDWLIESDKKNVLLDYRNFYLKAFYDLKFYFYEFEENLKNELENVVKGNQGIVVQNLKESNFVICQSQNLEMDFNQKENKSKLWIFYYWLQICDNYQQYIQPDRYMLLNQELQTKRITWVPTQEQIYQLMEQLDTDEQDQNFFRNFLFFIDQTVNKDKYKVVKDIINYLGGFYVTEYIENVTHVVASNLQLKEIEKYENQNKQFVVHPDYIFLCCMFRKKLLEIEYPPKILKNKLKENQQSQNFPFLRSASQTQSKEPRFKTFLFKGYVFYLDPKIPNYGQYKLKIIENSGNVIIKLSQDKIQKIICIQADGQREDLKKKLKQIFNRCKVSFFSYRWIDFCLERKTVIKDIGREGIVQAIPFEHTLPFQSFINKNISLKGFDENKKLILINLIELLGANYVKYKEIEPGTYVIIKDKNVQVSEDCIKRDIQWIFKSVQRGHFLGQLKAEIFIFKNNYDIN